MSIWAPSPASMTCSWCLVLQGCIGSYTFEIPKGSVSLPSQLQNSKHSELSILIGCTAVCIAESTLLDENSVLMISLLYARQDLSCVDSFVPEVLIYCSDNLHSRLKALHMCAVFPQRLPTVFPCSLSCSPHGQQLPN